MKQVKIAVISAAVLGTVVAGSASAAPAEILAAVATAQTDGVLVASAITLMLFAFAAAKWLRRAK